MGSRKIHYTFPHRSVIPKDDDENQVPTNSAATETEKGAQEVEGGGGGAGCGGRGR